MKREYPSTPDESFATANEGLYYGVLMTKARNEKRICRVYYDEAVPVCTSWDLGYGDSTAIWFYQLCGQEIHLIDFFEDNGKPLTYYLKLIKDKPYSYLKHFVPFDAGAHEYGTGMTRVEIAAKHGITFTIAPKLGIAEGIDAVRNLLNKCWFDEGRCGMGIRMLESYKRGWDDKNGCWREDPKHDASSHCCDAFRILAVSQNLAKPGLTADEIRTMRDRNTGGTGAGRYQQFYSPPPFNPFGSGFSV